MLAREILRAIINDGGECAGSMGIGYYNHNLETREEHVKHMFGSDAVILQGRMPVCEYIWYYTEKGCIKPLDGKQCCVIGSEDASCKIYIYEIL